MPADLPVPWHLVLGFLLAFTRIAGIFTFVPLPGLRSGFDAPKLLLSLSLAIGLSGNWPKLDPAQFSAAGLVFILFQELLLGLAVGLLVGFLAETFLLAFQIPALQAGYTYASTIDPNSSADSNVLQVISQLACGLLFFAMDMHLRVIRAVVASLQGHPPGSISMDAGVLDLLGGVAQSMFETALRLALPVVSMLLMVDVALALMSRLNSQLQLIALIFPVKMLIALLMLAWLTALLPTLYQSQMDRVLAAIDRLLSP